MMEIKNFKQAEAVLMYYMPLVKEMTGRDITVERMRPLMNALGNPEQKLKAVHIAGTSGKTSTTYYITALLNAAGQKTGTTVSPHIDSLAERVQINGQPLPEQEFCRALSEFLSIIAAVDMVPTYFELMISFAYWYFAQAEVDYAVIETGLGGLHDSTNILQSANKVCVITDIGYDHIEILGKTLPEIAAQKAGIIHPGNHAFMYAQGEEIDGVIEAWCQKQQAHLVMLDRKTLGAQDHMPEAVQSLPVYQQGNWILAKHVFAYIAQRDGLPGLSTNDYAATTHIKIPARMDERTVDGKTVIMDGAHNAQKMQAFVAGIKKNFPHKSAALLLSLKSDKDFTDIFPMLAEISDTIIVTSFSLAQDIPVQSTDLTVLKIAAAKYFTHVYAVEDQQKAYEAFMALPQELLIITGSFYLIGQLRQQHKELQYDRG